MPFRYASQDAIPRIAFTSRPSYDHLNGDPPSPLPLSSCESTAETEEEQHQLPYLVETSFPLKWPKSLPRPRTPGFQNLGNTCYMNSVLQALMHVPPFAHLLDQEYHKSSYARQAPKGGKGFCGLHGLVALRNEMISTRHNTIAPRYFANNLRQISALFKTYKMECAAEFSNNLLESCSRAYILGPAKSSARYSNIVLKDAAVSSTPIHQVFGGRLNSTVVCSTCGYNSIREEYFRELHVEINRCHSLHDALSKFTKPEFLHGANKYHCERCQKKVDASKRYSIRQAPNVLTIILKRFQDRNRKNNARIQFTEQLDITKYLAAGNPTKNVTYELSAVVCHEGSSTNSGHYYAVVRSPDGNWTTKDDSFQRDIRLDQVLAKKAYVLFYTRRNSHPTSLPPCMQKQKQAPPLKRKAPASSHLLAAPQKSQITPRVADNARTKRILPVASQTTPPVADNTSTNRVLVVGRGTARKRTLGIFPSCDLKQSAPSSHPATVPKYTKPKAGRPDDIATWDASEAPIRNRALPGGGTVQKRNRVADVLDCEYDAGRKKKVVRLNSGAGKRAFASFVSSPKRSSSW